MLAMSACTQSPASIVINTISDDLPKSLAENPFKIRAKKGDTIYKIARRHGVEIRDLIDKNRLRPPYILNEGQIIKLPNATFHVVSTNETIYAVSRSYDVAIDRLIKANNIADPYIIHAGQRLRLPSKTEKIDTIFSDDIEIADNEPKVPTIKNLRIVVARDLGKIQPKKLIITQKIDPNAPKPTLKSNSYPRPVLKNGKKFSAKKTIVRSALIPKKSNKKLSFKWPVKGRLLSNFGPKKGGLYNDGINISAKEGTPIKAAENGIVVYSGNELRGYGNLVLIRHNKGYITAYAHTKNIAVKKGDHVRKGQIISYVGKTGHVSSPQLHFSIRKGRKAVNPKKYLSRYFG